MSNGTNTVPDEVEQIEKKRKQKADESMTTRAIKQFIESKLLGSDGATNFNEIISNKGNGLTSDFLKFIAMSREFDESSKEQKEAFNAIENARFLRETIRIGTGFESKREVLNHLVQDEYEGLTPLDIKVFDARVSELSLADLTHNLRNPSDRQRFVHLTFPKTPLKKKEFLAFLDSLRIDGKSLNDDQKQAIRMIRDLDHVDEDSLRGILPLFSTLEQKQMLIRAFLPTISLGDLVRMKIITETEARKAVTEKVWSGEILKSLKNIKSEVASFIAAVDLDEIIIPTKLFPEEVVDRIISVEGVKQIKKELNTLFDETKKEEQDEFWLTPDKEGKYLNSFIEKTKKEIIGKDGKCRIENIDAFWPGAILQGSMQKGTDTQRVYIRIDGVNEESESETAKKTLTITHLTGPNGTIIKNPSATKKETVRFQDMFALLGEFSDGKILKPDDLGRMIEEKKIHEVAEMGNIQTIAELNARLDLIDPKGSEFSLQTGKKTAFTIHSGKAGFGTFSVQDIDEAKHMLRVNTGAKIEGPYTFDEFFINFREQNGERITSLNTINETLNALKKHSKSVASYKEIEVLDGKLVPNDRKNDKDFPGIKHFVGRDGKLVEILEIQGDKVRIKVHEGYNEKTNESNHATAPTWYGWEVFYMLIEEYGCNPKTPPAPVKPDDVKELHPHRKHGFLKHYMGNPSIHDMFAGAKTIVDHIKHGLEHGSKANAAKFALAFATKLHLPEDTLTDLRWSVHTSNKKMTDDTVNELNGLATPIRHGRIKNIIMNHGSHDYEVHAAMISMLWKHGTLYAGGLKDLEGTYIWYTALGGTPNDAFMMKTKKSLAEKKEPFREEALVREYLKFLGGKDGWFSVDPNLWVKGVKLPWREGIENEMKSGAGEADGLLTIDGRLDYVFDKWKGKEYANGIGALSKVWTKWGSPEQMQEGAFILAMSNIPDHLAQNQLDGLGKEFYAGHPYPGLLFVTSPADQDIFRKVVKKFSENSGEMKSDYAKIEKLLHHDHKTILVEEIKNFWRKYGGAIAPKLTMTKDPEIFAKKDSDSDFKAYHEKISKAVDGMDTNKEEIAQGTYGYKHSSFGLANMKRYVSEVDVNAGNGNMNNDKEKYFFEQLIEGIDDVKNQKIHKEATTPGQISENKALQKKIYREYHLNILSRLATRLNGDAFDKLNSQPYMKELIKRWFSKPETNDADRLKGMLYEDHLSRDFEKYLSSSGTLRETEDTTLDSYDKIMNRSVNDV